jgi:hypothetical protein
MATRSSIIPLLPTPANANVVTRRATLDEEIEEKYMTGRLVL